MAFRSVSSRNRFYCCIGLEPHLDQSRTGAIVSMRVPACGCAPCTCIYVSVCICFLWSKAAVRFAFSCRRDATRSKDKSVVRFAVMVPKLSGRSGGSVGPLFKHLQVYTSSDFYFLKWINTPFFVPPRRLCPPSFRCASGPRIKLMKELGIERG